MQLEEIWYICILVLPETESWSSEGMIEKNIVKISLYHPLFIHSIITVTWSGVLYHVEWMRSYHGITQWYDLIHETCELKKIVF